ncbi:glycosyltransferase family 4 protein [Candidatus Leptofilum sp.]|uniref:glycosyltransferase family 4 protein n=1 Tax=Candidatus Leptofilum sp. TaxID=3241576 RepID=UPI003B5C12F2
MRVLFITAYFPPCQYGWGYMRICEQVADGLAERGHDVAVLTSTYQDGPEVKPYPVYRHLTIEPDWLLPDSPAKQFFSGRKQRERTAVSHLHQTIANFKPDVLFIWDAFGLSDAMLREAEESDIPVAYYFANYLPEFPGGYVHYWSSTNSHPLVKLAKLPMSLLAKAMLAREGKPIKLKYEHTISVSDYVRQRLLSQNLIGSDAIVAPNAVDLAMFSGEPRQPEPDAPLRCLVAGRVAPEKGIHTILHAFGKLHQKGQLQNISLTILGKGTDEYKEHLKQLVIRYQLEKFTNFAEPVPIEAMPTVLAEHDLLLLPSEWDEPLSCSMLEGMAAGLMVIGTTRGGSGEALFHGKTGLTFKDGDADALAKQLLVVTQDRSLVARLAAAGKVEVETNFNMDVSVSRIEDYLAKLVGVETAVPNIT